MPGKLLAHLFHFQHNSTQHSTSSTMYRTHCTKISLKHKWWLLKSKLCHTMTRSSHYQNCIPSSAAPIQLLNSLLHDSTPMKSSRFTSNFISSKQDTLYRGNKNVFILLFLILGLWWIIGSIWLHRFLLNGIFSAFRLNQSAISKCSLLWGQQNTQ